MLVRQEVNEMHTPHLIVAYSSPGTFLPRNPDDAGPVGVVLVADRSPCWLVVRRGGHVLARTDRVQATKRLRRAL
jgi:hypothetical protein